MFLRILHFTLILLVLATSAKAQTKQASQKNLELYVLMGQSNMAGRGELEDTPEPIHPRVQMLTFENQWEPAIEPLHNDNPHLAGAGLGASFAKEMAEAKPMATIGIVPCAVGGTPLSRWQKGGELYERTLKRIQAAMPAGKLKGIVWHQGETDALDPDLASSYGERLSTMIEDLRTDLSMPKLPFVAGQVGDFAPDMRKGKTNHWKMVNRQIADLPQRNTSVAVVESVGLSDQGDSVHFDTPSLRTFGKRYAAAMIDLQAKAGSVAPYSSFLPLTTNSVAQVNRAKTAGLLDIAPVNLPQQDNSDCNHFGWPIATTVGDTIVVMHRRIPGHNRKGAGAPDDTMSYGIVLRSEDGGQTWSSPYDLRDCMSPENRTRGGLVPLSHRAKFDPKNMSPEGYKIHLHSIGTTRDGAIVAINNHGVFRSEDAGRTWKHFPKALREDTFPHEMVNLGPRIIDHPQRGLLAFGNWFGEVNTAHTLQNSLVILSSQDGGETWTTDDRPAGFPQYEPAALLFNDEVLFVTRDQTKVRSHKQMAWNKEGNPIVIDTNLKNPRYVDTVDFSFNPVTKRFEIVRSERYHMELWLWSIDPKDWETGQWTRECRLLGCEGKFYQTADGFHPAGAVIDEKKGVQHIFIYSGHPNGPAGIFRITRTLDTRRLTTVISQGQETVSNNH
ncbi:sialate O-acetylesterase [Bremerella alba]|uniref:Sialate O-acetylesterase domain-containing protein n=1 Tax=Bremerella alba TaxID=980252 RepID=A0A7V8V6C2_9BACT|nr:sialate O-acetylesterase [Bremerella alba]MBA2115571.1 hypothetical protein [Bremerella alba]